MNIGFKEWAIVCEALGSGRQQLILRKGGIAEGRAGFRFAHPEFFLFPTWFHEQIKQTRLPADSPLPPRAGGRHGIRYFARVEWADLVTDWAKIEALAPFHIYSENLLRERFRYDDAEGLNVAAVRVFRLETDWVFEDRPAYGGCRSNVEESL